MNLKKILREYPVPGCVAVALSVFVLSWTVGMIRKLLPDSILIDFARQLVNILWPLALTFLLGYGWCYRRGAFGKTLLAGLFALILFSLTFLIRLGEALFSDETSWKTAAGILLGIVNILGITVFLLRKKKMDAVFENLKQASEYDRKVSGMNY